MLAPSSLIFTEGEKVEILKWKDAAIFYGKEFNLLARKSQQDLAAKTTPEQKGSMTIQYNEAIKAGKDRFKELLLGTEKMRSDKETESLAIASKLDSLFDKFRISLLVSGLLLSFFILISTRNSFRAV
jgi:hypothetical protein